MMKCPPPHPFLGSLWYFLTDGSIILERILNGLWRILNGSFTQDLEWD